MTISPLEAETLKNTFGAVLQRAEDCEMTLNLDKCEFGVEELKFYGYRVIKEGLKHALDKTKAIKDSGCPEPKEAVNSFLGMIGYFSKLIP